MHIISELQTAVTLFCKASHSDDELDFSGLIWLLDACCVSRLIGSAEFRHKLLARHGQVVVIPYHKLSREGVKAELEAATGVPLHQAFEICTSPSVGKGLPQLQS